jgi:hypothetical protein
VADYDRRRSAARRIILVFAGVHDLMHSERLHGLAGPATLRT